MTPIYECAIAATKDAYDYVLQDIEAIADPVAKLAAYARIASNLEPEQQLASIRLRAEMASKRALREIRGTPPVKTTRKRAAKAE